MNQYVYLVIDWRSDGGNLATNFAFQTQESAERYANQLREFLEVPLAAIEVICVPVGDYHNPPS